MIEGGGRTTEAGGGGGGGGVAATERKGCRTEDMREEREARGVLSEVERDKEERASGIEAREGAEKRGAGVLLDE